MRSDWFPCRSRTFASPIHRGGTLNGSSRHWLGNVSSLEQGAFSIPNGSLLLSGLGSSGRAIRTHDLEQILRALFGRPLPDVSGTGVRGPFPGCSAPHNTSACRMVGFAIPRPEGSNPEGKGLDAGPTARLLASAEADRHG